MVARHERLYAARETGPGGVGSGAGGAGTGEGGNQDAEPVAGRDFNKDGVIERKWVKWPDGTSNETTYDRDGKPKKRESFDKDGKLVREIIYDKDGKPKTRRTFDKDGKLVEEEDLAKMDLRPEPPTVFSGATRVQGIVIGMPERFGANEPISFRVVRIDGQVVENDKVEITNSEGETVSASTNQDGVVSTRIPAGWADAVVTVLGAQAMSYLASTGSPGAPVRLNGAPKFIEPGNVVSLHGTNFEPDLLGNTVTIGGRPATVLGATSNSLTVLVPAGSTPGTVKISVANDSGTATADATVIALEVMPGPSTLLQGQRVTRTVRVVGTQERLPLLVTDSAGDAARVENPGTLYSSGGANNTAQIGVASLQTGAYSFLVGLDWDWVVQGVRIAGGKLKAEAAARQANVDEYFGAADDARGRKERNAAREWRNAARSWRDAMHAWQDGDKEAAEAAEAKAKEHEGKARDAHWK
jgi:hypothetical protein